MNFKIKTLLAGALLASSSVVANVAQAGTTGNIAATSNYIWRGVTQTGDSAAVQGGVDYAHDSGFYVGGWTSNVSGGYELDLYAGYSMDAGPVGLDFGAITYEYPVADDYFRELYFNGTWNVMNFGVAYTFGSKDNTSAEFSDGDIYAYVGAGFEVAKGLELSGTIGSYNFDNTGGEDYVHFQVAMSKDDFTVALDKNDKTDTGAGEDSIRFSVSWSKEFDLIK